MILNFDRDPLQTTNLEDWVQQYFPFLWLSSHKSRGGEGTSQQQQQQQKSGRLLPSPPPPRYR